MCGIFGYISHRPRSAQEGYDILQRGMEAIRHRGPDGDGTWLSEDGAVGLGHVRLAIIDIADGDQPMVSDDGRYVLIFNGEIYNYIELRAQIGKDSFRTGSDTEVILRAWQLWGKDCLSHLRGMFAFVIYDRKDGSMTLVRDRFGIKPLYYANTREGLYFSSEIKALLSFLDVIEPDQRALSDYFTFQYTLGAKSMMAGVRQIPAAHSAQIKAGQSPAPTRYWEVQYDIDYDHTEAWFSERLRELLHESVDMHTRADVDVGAYVSGGIDSSLLACLAAEKRHAPGLRGFNGRFTDDPSFDESRYAQAVAERHDADLTITDITEQDFVDNIAKVLWHMDQPNAGPGSFPQYMVSRDVGRTTKVVLGGQGGDEIFGGYARYLVAYFEQCIKGAIEGTLNDGNFVVTYESIIPNLQTLREYKPMLRQFWAEGLFEDRDQRYWRLVNRSHTIKDILADGIFDEDQVFAEFHEIFWGDNVRKASYFDSMTHFDFKTLLPALLHVEDRMSMAHGVEARVPFLDHPLIEFAATIPSDIKFKDGELKRLLKTVFRPELPTQITARKDKMGFPVPLNMWIKRGGPARELVADTLGSAKAQQRPYLENGINLDALLAGEGTFGRNLWALLSLELWHQQFIDA